MSEPLRRTDFSESSDGNCRIGLLFAQSFETASTWGKLGCSLADTSRILFTVFALEGLLLCSLKTPLTQTIVAKRRELLFPRLKMPRTEHVCRGWWQTHRNELKDCGLVP